MAILAIVALNALLGYLQESRARRALEALGTLAPPRAQVCRDGRWCSLPQERLVPGDVVRLEAGR